MISDFFYYALYTSAILVYGLGINRATVISEKPQHAFLFFVKMVLTVCISSVLTYLVDTALLQPAHLAELYPFAGVLIFILITVFIESLIRITAKVSVADFGVSLLCILLSVNECTSLVQCLFISFCCTFSFYFFVPFLFAIQKRIELARPASDFRNSSLTIISIALILIALVSWNVSWLNPGVLK